MRGSLFFILASIRRTPLPSKKKKPTAITESRNAAELRKEAEDILAALLPEYGHDRAAALAAMREAAPTLSEYVN